MSIPPELAGAIPLIDRFQVCDYFIPTSSATCATFVKTEYPSCQFGNRSENVILGKLPVIMSRLK